MQQTTSHNCVIFFLYASNMPISCLYILACFCPYALQNSEDETFGCFCGWVIVSNESASVVFGLYLISKAKSCSIFSLIKKSHHWCILLALKSRTGLYSLMIGKHTKWQYVCLQLSFQSIAQKLGPLLQLQCSPLKSFGYSINVLVKKQSRCFPPFLQVDFSLSSPIFWTREYFLHEDLKQLGGQDIGQEKLQGTEPCTFFSKK